MNHKDVLSDLNYLISFFRKLNLFLDKIRGSNDNKS
jgi:hypothetical protein